MAYLDKNLIIYQDKIEDETTQSYSVVGTRNNYIVENSPYYTYGTQRIRRLSSSRDYSYVTIEGGTLQYKELPNFTFFLNRTAHRKNGVTVDDFEKIDIKIRVQYIEPSYEIVEYNSTIEKGQWATNIALRKGWKQEGIRITISMPEYTSADNIALPDIYFMAGKTEIYTDENILKTIINQTHNPLGLQVTIPQAEITMKREISDEYKKGTWTIIRYNKWNYDSNVPDPYGLGNQELQQWNFILDEVENLTDNTYYLKLLGAEQRVKTQQVTTDTLYTFHDVFVLSNRNPEIENYIEFNNGGNFNELDVLEAANQECLSASAVLKIEYEGSKIILGSDDDLLTKYNEMTAPTHQQEDSDIDIYVGGTYSKQQIYDGVAIYYNQYRGTTVEYETELLNDSYMNAQTSDKKVIGQVNYIIPTTIAVGRERIAQNLFLYSTFYIYKGKFLTEGRIYSAGEVITINTEFGLLKGIILNANIETTQIRSYESIELLVMKTA